MDYRSPIGLFGFGKESPFLGSFYWWVLLAFLTLFLAVFYANGKRRNNR
jgi:hypothetical protein